LTPALATAALIMPSRRNDKKRATRGAQHPEGRGSQRWHERPINPLDIDDAGKNKRELAAAARRSGTMSTNAGLKHTKSRSIAKHAAPKLRRMSKRAADAIDQTKDALAGSPKIARNKLRDRKHAPAASGRKGGPGKRRPYPKKTARR
jgi:hypothetical protein